MAVRESTQELEGESKNSIMGAINQLQKHAKEEALANAEVAKYYFVRGCVGVNSDSLNTGILQRKRIETS